MIVVILILVTFSCLSGTGFADDGCISASEGNYSLGESWQNGCMDCTCTKLSSGKFHSDCFLRCRAALNGNTDPECVLEPDSHNHPLCCDIPECNEVPTSASPIRHTSSLNPFEITSTSLQNSKRITPANNAEHNGHTISAHLQNFSTATKPNDTRSNVQTTSAILLSSTVATRQNDSRSNTHTTSANSQSSTMTTKHNDTRSSTRITSAILQRSTMTTKPNGSISNIRATSANLHSSTMATKPNDATSNTRIKNTSNVVRSTASQQTATNLLVVLVGLITVHYSVGTFLK